MAKTIKLAEYLFLRLKQLGIGAVHGVPGDYNLELLDYVEPAGLLWVGSTNELNAGYAADGYARIRGLSALITTYGVGELSAINAIACSFTERAAVVHIVGTPPRDSQESRLMIHHTLGDGDYRHFGKMAAHVTAAQISIIDSRTAPQQIDDILQQCILHSRPVYIELPLDLVAAPVLADSLDTHIRMSTLVPDPVVDEVLEKVLDRMYTAKQPVIYVDGETRSLGITENVRHLVELTKWPTFTSPFGKGLLDETSPNVYGVYQGRFDDPKTKQLVEDSDLILCFGPHYSTTNSYSLSAVPKTEVSIGFTHSGISIASKKYRNATSVQVLSQLLEKLDSSKTKSYDTDLGLPRRSALSFSETSPDESIKQEKIWRLLSGFLRPGDIVMGETGTASFGVREMLLPKHSRAMLPVTWLSIGYMLPASQGAALAQRELIASSQYNDLKEARVILFIGDGSFQMTAQELATIIRHNLNVVIFLINNDGYTIERCIHGINQGYNDISKWRYLQAPNFFGGSDDTYTNSAKNYGELEKVLSDESLADGKGLRMVEIYMNRNDAPEGQLKAMINMQMKKEASKGE